MNEMDTVTFMERNGRGFFDLKGHQASREGELVEIPVSIPVTRAQLREIYAHTQRDGVTVEEFLAGIIERFLDER